MPGNLHLSTTPLLWVGYALPPLPDCGWAMYGRPTPALGVVHYRCTPAVGAHFYTPAVGASYIATAPLPWVSPASLQHPCCGCAMPRCCTPAVGEPCLTAAPLP